MTPDNYNPTTWNWGYILTQAATLGLKIIGAILILVIGYFVATFLSKVLDRVLEKVGFDRLIERGGIKRAMSRTGWDASTLVSKVVFYALMLFVLSFALNVFGPNPISTVLNQFIAFFPNILVAIAIVVLAAAIGSAVRDIVNGAVGGLNYGPALANAAYVGILVMGVFMALNQLHIAPEIVNGLFYACLAIIVGISVVAIGGGGIKPMEERWRSAMSRVDQEVPRIAQQINGASDGQAYRSGSTTVVQTPGQVYPTQPGNMPQTPQNPNSGYMG